MHHAARVFGVWRVWLYVLRFNRKRHVSPLNTHRNALYIQSTLDECVLVIISALIGTMSCCC